MLGRAALAMWWDMAAQMRAEFEDWHTREHFPERLALPGFLRASRWQAEGGGEGFFVLYELASADALVSPEYLARLDDPTPWSRRLMPHHRYMVRSPSVVVHSRGGMEADHVLTLRLPAAWEPGDAEALAAQAAGQAGIAGVHLLRHQPLGIAATTEQRIRGLADRAADWIVVVAGTPPALDALTGDAGFAALLQRPGATAGRYGLRLRVRPEDVQAG